MPFNENFLKIVKISSTNANTSKNSSLGNLIQGPTVGFSLVPPFECLSWDSWKTTATNNKNISYFEQYQQGIVIDLYLSEKKAFDAIGIWPSRENTGLSIREFLLQFSINEDEEFTNPIKKVARQRNPHDIEIFEFPKIVSNKIRITILSNYSHLNLRSNRVNIREITVINDYKKVQKAIDESRSDSCNFDFNKQLISNDLSEKDYFALNIKPEFSLDKRWKPHSSYKDFLKMRGFYSDGEQLRRIDLSKWADKIYVYNFLKENGIKAMPILRYSYYLNMDIIEYAKEQFFSGKLKSFVIKTSHLGYGVSVLRVKNGKFITNDEHHKGNKRTGTTVDFDYIKSEIKRHWNRQQFADEWACNVLPPGLILEELIENPVELKYIVVFGEIIGIVLQAENYPAFDTKGRSVDSSGYKLPFWWEDGLKKAKEVANLVKADHIRIDLFYHKGEIVVCEITYNGANEPIQFQEQIAQKLNDGYKLRASYLENKTF